MVYAAVLGKSCPSVEVSGTNSLAEHSSSASGLGVQGKGMERNVSLMGAATSTSRAQLEVPTPWDTLGDSSSVSFNVLI